MLRETNDDDEQRFGDGDSWSVAIWDGQKTPEDVFAREGGGLDEAEVGGGPIHASWPSPAPGGSRENRRPTKDDDKDDDVRQSMRLMGLGTIFVVGAVSANVFAFRRSKWAVGKELHRAYERQQAYHAGQKARRAASSRASAPNGAGAKDDEYFARAARNAARHAAAKASNAARAAAERAARAAAERAARAAAERMARAAAEAEQAARAAEAASRRQRGQQGAGGAGTQWETWTSNGRQYSRRVEFDAEDIEELLRKMGTSGSTGSGFGGGGRGRGRGGARNADDLLDEIFRAMGGGGAGGASPSAESQRRARARHAQQEAREFDAMFEEMFRAARTASRGGGFQGFGAFGGFGGFEGQQWPGVHQQGDFGYAQHYRTLGLEPGADAGAVKAAYRKLVMQYHPDRYRGGDPEGAARRFREVTQAYEALTKK